MADLNQLVLGAFNQQAAAEVNENPYSGGIRPHHHSFSLSVRASGKRSFRLRPAMGGRKGASISRFQRTRVHSSGHPGNVDMVIDPPFVREECWRKYAVSAASIEGGGKLLTTILENAELLEGCLASIGLIPTVRS